MSNIFHRWDDLKRLQAGEMITPNFVDLHLSDICNQDCTGCAFKAGHENDRMSEDRFLRAADILLDNGVKAFAFCGGGEPCCVDYLPRAWRHIRSRGAHFAMLTNGSLLDDETIQLMVAEGTFIRVSLEASNPESYAAYKHVPVDVWGRVLDNVRKLVAFKTACHSQCSIGIKFSVAKSLRGQYHYEDGLRLADELGVDRVTFKSITGEPEELELAEKRGEEVTFQEALDDVRPATRVTHWIIPVPAAKVPQCWLNPIHTVMNWRGDLFICCYYYFRRERHKLGNIFETGFKELWFSQNHKDKIRDINRAECAKVDCKFFHYHDDFAETDKVGSLYLV